MQPVSFSPVRTANDFARPISNSENRKASAAQIAELHKPQDLTFFGVVFSTVKGLVDLAMFLDHPKAYINDVMQDLAHKGNS